MDLAEFKSLLDEQGKAFDAFKKTHSEEMTELKKSGAADPVLIDRMSKIEKSLDGAVEAEAAVEAALKAEQKAREDLEAKINRLGLAGESKDSAEMQVKLATFNTELKSLASMRQRPFEPLDVKGYEDYGKAFNRFMREGEKNLTPDEVKTLNVGTDPDGGYWVRPDVSGQIVKKVYESSPVRQYASVQTISTNRLEGMEDLNEAGCGYAGEQAQGSDSTTPQIGKWAIDTYWIDTEPKATQQLLDDASVDVEAWLAGKVADKVARFENNEFITGAAAKIRGFINGYSPAADSGSGVTWGSFGYTYTGVDADWAATNKGDKLLDVMGTLKNAYLPNAIWIMKRATIMAVRKFKDGQGNYMWQPSFVAGVPETLLGYPVVRMEDMPTIASQSYSVAFGDLKQAYQVVDRNGIRVLRDPYTSKPYIKFYTTKRTGGGALNFEALKLLKFYTS
jgi:HK97 family phage major capsid protein